MLKDLGSIPSTGKKQKKKKLELPRMLLLIQCQTDTFPLPMSPYTPARAFYEQTAYSFQNLSFNAVT
jgi:hypothetical protein